MILKIIRFQVTILISEHLYAIPDKNKGSCISLYYKKYHLFNRISSLDIRNNYFECMGDVLKLKTLTYT